MRGSIPKSRTLIPFMLILLMVAPTLTPFAQTVRTEKAILDTDSIQHDGQLQDGQLGGLALDDLLKLDDYPEVSESHKDSFSTIWGEPNVRALARSESRGEIYIGTNTGLIIYNPTTSNTQHLTVADGLPGPLVQDIEVDEANGRLFLGSTTHNNGRISPGGGISIYDLNTGTFLNRNSIWGISNNNVRAIEYDESKQRLYLATANGLSIYDIQDDRFVNKYRKSGLPSRDLRDLEFDASSNKLYIATWDYSSSGQRKGGGLSVFDTNTWSFTNYNMSYGLVSRNLLTLLLSSDTLYIGCYRYKVGNSNVGGGLNLLHIPTMTFSNYTYTNGLRSNEVKDLALDTASQKLYIATNRYGNPARGGSLNILELSTGHFENRTTTNGLLTTYVQKLMYVPNYGIICGCDRGYCVYDPTMDSFDIPQIGDGLPAREVRYVLEYGERHTLFIGTRNGLFIQDTRTGELMKRDTTSGLPNNDARALALDKNSDKLYVATWGGGIGIYDIQGDTFDVFSTSQGLRTNYILCLNFNDDKLYIGEWERGLGIYDTVQDTLFQIGLGDGMPSHRIRNIEVEPDGTKVYIATSRYWNGSAWTGGGLCIYDTVFTGCTVIDQDVGLMSNQVFGLALDNERDLLYIGTGRYWDGQSTWMGGITYMSTLNNHLTTPDPRPFSDISVQSIELALGGDLVLLGCNRALGIMKDGRFHYRDLSDGLSYSNVYNIDVNETTGVLHIATYGSYSKWDFDLPVEFVSQIPDSLMYEDDLVSGNDLIDLTQYFCDPKDGNLTFNLIENNPHVNALLDVNGTHLDFIPKQDYNGIGYFRVQARDAGLDGILGTWDDTVLDSNEFTVTVEPVNDPPEFTSLEGASPVNWNQSIRIVEGKTKELRFTVDDRDGDLLNIEWSLLATLHKGQPILNEGAFSQLDELSDVPFEFKTSLQDFQPGTSVCNFSLASDGDMQSFNLTLKASDGNGGTSQLVLDIEVQQANDKPSIISIGDEPVGELLQPLIFSVLQGNELSLDVEAYDPDTDQGGDTLWFGCNLSDVMHPDFINRSSGEISYRPTKDDIGINAVQVFVGDSCDPIPDHFVNISIIVKPLFELPRVLGVEFDDIIYSKESLQPLTFYETVTGYFEVIIDDPNGRYGNSTPMTLGVDYPDALISRKDDNRFGINLTPVQGEIGTLLISVTLSDPDSNWDYDTLNLTLSVQNLNDAPNGIAILSPRNNDVFRSDSHLTLTGSATDDDTQYGDQLIYRWFSNVSGMLGKGKGIGNLTLPTGLHELTLEVSDLVGETLRTSINITIAKAASHDEENITGDSQKDEKKGGDESSAYWYAGAALLVLAVLNLLILMLLFIRKKRVDEEIKMAPEEPETRPTEPIVLRPSSIPVPTPTFEQPSLPLPTSGIEKQEQLEPGEPKLLLPEKGHIEESDQEDSTTGFPYGTEITDPAPEVDPPAQTPDPIPQPLPSSIGPPPGETTSPQPDTHPTPKEVLDDELDPTSI